MLSSQAVPVKGRVASKWSGRERVDALLGPIPSSALLAQGGGLQVV